LQEVPLFLYGSSFGSVLAFNLSIKYPTLFTGMTLNAPFFRHYSNLIDNYKYAFKFCHLFNFFFSISMRDPSSPAFKEFAKKYPWALEDEKIIYHAKISTISLFLDE
jgi:alpha-beta hydrolase superfamily lysophospholipase